MNVNMLYEIYAINEGTQGEDLSISLAKYQAQHPGMSNEESKAVRAFIGSHGPDLAKAFNQSFDTFAALVEELNAAAAEDEEAQ